MINSVSVKNLKGLTFTRKLGEKTLIIGPNGSGKTCISIAAQLAVNGYIPGTSKKNADILAAFSSENRLVVGADVGGVRFDRQWSKSPKGKVSQYYMVETRKETKETFIEWMVKSGNPKIFDLARFMELSDQKKTDYIFALFPPAEDLNKLEKQVETLSETVKSHQKKILDRQAFINQTIEQRDTMQLPAGTAAEVITEIESVETDLNEARISLMKAQEKEREDEAFKKGMAAQQEIKDRAPTIDLPADPPREEGSSGGAALGRGGWPGAPRSMGGGYERATWAPGPERGRTAEHTDTPVFDKEKLLSGSKLLLGSLKKIQEALDFVQCPNCAVVQVIVKQEIAKWTKLLEGNR